VNDSLEAEIDQLFQAPRESFTKARDALVKRLRAAKDTEAAQRVKSLTKPSVSAWAINRAWWTARADVDALLDAAEHVRQAQARGDLERMRAAERTRRTRHQALLDHAASWIGSNATALRKVAVNLDALAAHGRARLPGVPGRWSEDLDPPGFELLGPAIGLVPALAEPVLSTADTRDDRALRAAVAGRDEALQRHQQAEGTAATAGAAHRAALASEAEAEEALRQARIAFEGAAAHRRAAAETLERATSELAVSRRELESAEAALRELEG
jgi:hypothetical protein